MPLTLKSGAVIVGGMAGGAAKLIFSQSTTASLVIGAIVALGYYVFTTKASATVETLTK